MFVQRTLSGWPFCWAAPAEHGRLLKRGFVIWRQRLMQTFKMSRAGSVGFWISRVERVRRIATSRAFLQFWYPQPRLDTYPVLFSENKFMPLSASGTTCAAASGADRFRSTAASTPRRVSPRGAVYRLSPACVETYNNRR